MKHLQGSSKLDIIWCKVSPFDSLCLVEFLRYYYLPQNSKHNENDYELDELADKIQGSSHNIAFNYPNKCYFCLQRKN